MKTRGHTWCAWAVLGKKTYCQIIIDLFSCEECLTEDEKKDLEPGDDFLMVDLPADEKHFCDRCGKVLGGF